ncbi:MAG: MFS transporter [Oscillospiraceae bacterium]|nr:MFS transporter [Oscillospiraceae bacterium]
MEINNTDAKQSGSKALMLVLLLIALIQMPQIAVLPAIEQLTTEVFPDRTLQSIQTVMGLISFMSVATGIIGAIIIRWGVSSKKTVTILGIVLIASAGVGAFFLNTRFWHVIVLNALIGAGMGFCIPNSQSIVFDSFDEKRRQFMVGMTSAFLSAGGVIMGVGGGLLIAIVWYGGYLMALLALPVIVLSIIYIPSARQSVLNDAKRSSKLPGAVFFYGALIFLFSVVFNVAGMNISTHIANGNIGDAAFAGLAAAMPMLGGIVMGLLFVKMSNALGDKILPLAFFMLFVGFTILNVFPTSLVMTLLAMFLKGLGLSMFMPRCLFNVSNITDPSNSSTATMLVLSIAPGSGGFLSPIIMTNLTFALGGDSTRFRYQFTGFVCLAISIVVFLMISRKKTD